MCHISRITRLSLKNMPNARLEAKLKDTYNTKDSALREVLILLWQVK